MTGSDVSNLASLLQNVTTLCEQLLRLVESLLRKHDDTQTKSSIIRERLLKMEGKLDRLLDRCG